MDGVRISWALSDLIRRWNGSEQERFDKLCVAQPSGYAQTIFDADLIGAIAFRHGMEETSFEAFRNYLNNLNL